MRTNSIYPLIRNICFKAEEVNGKIVFLYQANEGSQNYSYGVEVAKLAGLPLSVVNAAREEIKEKRKFCNNTQTSHKNCLEELPKTDLIISNHHAKVAQTSTEIEDNIKHNSVISNKHTAPAMAHTIAEHILKLNLNNMTPLEVVIEINRLQNIIKKQP